jgi:hypothetical protein
MFQRIRSLFDLSFYEKEEERFTASVLQTIVLANIVTQLLVMATLQIFEGGQDEWWTPSLSMFVLLLKHLVECGHDVEVLLPITKIKPYEFEGVKVNLDTFRYTKDLVPKADLIISHLDRAGKALNLAEAFINIRVNSHPGQQIFSCHRKPLVSLRLCISSSGNGGRKDL